ncbi:phosphatidylinositol 4,5-bisphosphate 5-phosphatase A-like [Oncorhynchus keta]|uniref:phosphatidylinositol 4,5-bisphosphate 5-phosphatase A-like n=1 Tax=Oncorhynchus keta TaxID=8018 RepID=UPI00227BAFCF|nr:phosphatidylinositol 4,5-bisphosphate 5-phosphatase A-like [Oncorhynchus keta]
MTATALSDTTRPLQSTGPLTALPDRGRVGVMEYHSSGSLPLLGRPRYCPGASSNGGYLCETGHCCGETGCCTYYYELWWFWLLWTVLILFSCCCAYRHRRAKLRVQQQQRQREINLLAYHGATSYPSSMLDLSFLASLKLPSYEEVAAQPSTPPPPYSTVFAAQGGAARYPQPPHHPPGSHPHPGTSASAAPSSFSSDNSSSCSCDSCCPSSPCSTYETDTSRASTPTTLSQYAAENTAAVVLETVATVTSSEMIVSVSSDVDVAGGNRMGVVANAFTVVITSEADTNLSEQSTEPAQVHYFPGATMETVTMETDVCNVARLSSRNSPTSTEHPLVATTTDHPQAGTACPLTNPGHDRPSCPHSSSPTPTSAVPSPNTPTSAVPSLPHPPLLSPPLPHPPLLSPPLPHPPLLSPPLPHPPLLPTQSPPKQTLFSPCVDVYQLVPHTYRSEGEEEEEEQEEVGADESQYRHRRLTGDSGIEVCRCQFDLQMLQFTREELRTNVSVFNYSSYCPQSMDTLQDIYNPNAGKTHI